MIIMDNNRDPNNTIFDKLPRLDEGLLPARYNDELASKTLKVAVRLNLNLNLGALNLNLNLGALLR